MEQFKTQIDRLAELSEEELSSLGTDIVSAFDALSDTPVTQESVQQMTELADMLESVHSEGARRKAEAETLAEAAAAAAARVHGTEEDAEEDIVAEEDVVPEEETPEEDDEPVVAAADSEDAVEETVTVEEFAVEAEAEASVEEPVEAEAAVETPAEAEASVEEAETVEAEAPAEAEASVEVEEIAEASVSEVAETEAPVEAEASVVEETTIESVETQEEAQTVTASVEGAFEAPADRRPMAQVEETRTAITAGADIPGVAAGSILSDANEVAEAFVKRLDTLRRVNGGDGEQTIVASIVTEYDESRQLFGTGDQNWEKMVAARDEQASLVASGGVGTPFPVRYDIFGFGTDERPVKNSLPKFQADRGGIRFVKPPVLSSYADAVGIWTNDDDIAAASNNGTDDTVKNVLVVSGAVEASAGLDAVTVQLQIGNLLSRAYPELVARHNELALIQHAREAELNLLAKINAASTQVTTSGVIGVARDFLVNVRRAAAAYRSRHRISPNTRLQAIIPSWVVEAMAADLVLNMPGDNNLDAGRAEINALLAKINVSLVESLDQNTFGAQSAGALLEFPDSFTWFLFSEGSFLFLDGGTLDLGIVRDSALVGTNDYRMFVETFEGLAFVGIESLAITSTVAVNGTAAALIDTTGGASASAIEY